MGAPCHALRCTAEAARGSMRAVPPAPVVRRPLLLATAVAATLACGGATARAADTDATLRSVGSETMAALMARWAEAFARHGSGPEVVVEARGSATAPQALARGESQLAPMSRAMTAEETAAFTRARGHPPLAVTVAWDAVAVFVNARNPLRGLTLRELDAVFSADAACGGRPIRSWDALVLGPLRSRPVRTYGRDRLSGTRAFFGEAVLCGGRFREDLQAEEDSEAVVRAVARDPAGIGYSGVGFADEGVVVLAVARREDDPYVSVFVEPRADDPEPVDRFAWVLEGRYPLSRPLRIYVDKSPGEPLPAGLDAFLRFVLSDAGQESVEREGFVPLDAARLRRQRERLAPDGGGPWWWPW